MNVLYFLERLKKRKRKIIRIGNVSVKLAGKVCDDTDAIEMKERERKKKTITQNDDLKMVCRLFALIFY